MWMLDQEFNMTKHMEYLFHVTCKLQRSLTYPKNTCKGVVTLEKKVKLMINYQPLPEAHSGL